MFEGLTSVEDEGDAPANCQSHVVGVLSDRSVKFKQLPWQNTESLEEKFAITTFTLKLTTAESALQPLLFVIITEYKPVCVAV